MLQRLMVELVKDEEIVAENQARLNTEQLETEMEKSKRIREEKKREALERSKQRQNDPNYFAKRVEANSLANQPQPTSQPLVSEDDSIEEKEESIEVVSSNPFDSFPKVRSKIFVK
jgi:hypothetical protein